MYSMKEVRRLIEGYAELREVKETNGYGLLVLIKLADLERAIRAMPPKEYHTVLLHGQLRHTVRDAEDVLGVSRSTLSERYEAGVSWIVRFLNEGIEW